MRFLCIRAVGEGENDSTGAQGFTESGRYLVDHQVGFNKIQQRLDAKTDVTPPLLLQKKVTTKKLNMKMICVKSASDSTLGCETG